jgi:aminoglycoside 3-N-acetyltransferase
MRDLVRRLLPSVVLQWYRQRKKEQRNKVLNELRIKGEVLTKNDLIQQFKAIGLASGDSLLVHASLSKIGFVENGAQTVVEALLESVGSEGNLLMPNSPNTSFQLDYIRNLKEFDVANDRSGLGAISEYFRKLPNAIRSAHPTEPVSCMGPDAEWFTSEHFGEITPYTSKSPFAKLSQKGGKILYLGVTLDNAGTNLHTLEDAVSDFPFPVYTQEVFEVNVRFPDDRVECMQTKVHNPVQSKERRCDGLIPLFIEKGVMQKVQIGQAESLLVDAKGMLEVMLEAYNKGGVTMYTPQGTK